MTQSNARDFAIQLIKHFEGFRAHPYLCPAGLKTVGYGHVMEASFALPLPLSPHDGEALLAQDVACMRRCVRRLAPSLAWHREEALVSFVFNVGPFAFMRSTLRRRILRGDHEGAANEFHKWIWAGGRKLGGLIRRRAQEADLYRGHTL